MSFEPDSEERQLSMEELLEENTRWLRVVAHILGDIQNIDENEIYEGLE